MKGYRDTRLLEMLDYIDPKYIEKTKKYYKSVPVSGAAGAKIDPKKQIKYITALVAAVLLLSAFIPAVTYIIQNHLHFAGYSETTGGDTTLAPEITSEEITSSPEPESSAPETTETEPTHETTEPLYDGTTAPREETSTPEETTAEETTAEETTAEETTAEETTTPPEPEHDGSQGLEYQIEGDHAVLVGIGTCTDKDIVVASSYMGYPVKYIGWSAFEKNDDIKSVVIPEGIETIVQSAFRECSALVSVSLPESVKSIGDYAFYICPSLSEINLPNGLESIGKNAFAICTSLTQITIPESISVIKEYTFYACSALKQISIPESITRIEGGVFQGCSGISDLYIPKNVTYIGELNFQDVEKFTIDPENPKYSSAGNCFIDKETKTLLKMYENSVIPDDGSIEIIGETAIDAYLPIKELILPEGVRYICEGSLTAMATLEYLHLPSTFAEYEQNSFSHFLALKKITIADGNPKYYVKGNCLIERASGTVILGTSESTIPTDGSIKHIGAAAFAGNTNLTSIVIPEGVVSVQVNAFAGCSSLNKVTFPKSLERIGACAFRRCDSLKSIELGVNVKYIEAEAFSVCKGLTEIILPKQITSIGPSVFSGCESLESVILPEGVDEIDRTLFGSCSGLVSLSIPKSVTKIEKGVFADCKKLSDLVYSGTVREWNGIQKESGWNEGCPFTVVHCTDGDAEVNEHDGSQGLEYSISEDGYAIFAGIGTCTDSDIVIATEYGGYPVKAIAAGALSGQKNVRSVVIPEGISEIPSQAFYECTALKSVTIPSTVKIIGRNAFQGCSSLVEIALPAGLEKIDQYGFSQCTALESIRIEGRTTIKNYAFTYCSSLREVELGDSVTFDYTHIFNYCTSLESIRIPKRVTRLTSLFEGCTKLREVIMHDDIDDIDVCFYNCPALESFYIGPKVQILFGTIFYGCPGVKEIVYGGTMHDWYTIEKSSTWRSGAPNLKVIKCIDGEITNLNADSAAGSFGLLYEMNADGESATFRGFREGVNFGLEAEIATYYYGKPVTRIADELVNAAYFSGTLILPNGVESIGESQFDSMPRLKGVVLPKNLKSIDKDAFRGAPEVNTVTYLGSMAEWEKIKKNERWNYTAVFTTVHCSDGDLSITPFPETSDGSQGLKYYINSNGYAVFAGIGTCTESDIVIATEYRGYLVKAIAEGALRGKTNVRHVVIPEGITEIPKSAFYECTALESVTIPSTVKIIGEHAFQDCSSLHEIALPAGLEKIDQYGFSRCTALEKLEIPDGVSEIGYAAFSRLDSVERIYIPKSVTELGWMEFNEINNFEIDPKNPKYAWKGNCFIDKETKTLITMFKNAVIPDDGSVEIIGEDAFGWERGLTELILPEGVKHMRNLSIYGFEGIEYLHLPSTFAGFDEYALRQCIDLKKITVAKDNPHYYVAGDCLIDRRTDTVILGLVTAVIPDDGSIKHIGDRAFADLSIESIRIPEGVVSIETGAFSGCAKLKEVILPESLESVGVNAFFGCSSLKKIELGENVRIIGNSAFAGCEALEEILLPEDIESIGESAFSSCRALKRVVLPNGFEGEHYIFSSCNALGEVVLPDGMKLIGRFFFGHCYILENIEIPDSVTEIAHNAFYSCSALKSIVIPKSVASIDSSAFAFCDALEEIYYDGSIEEWNRIEKHEKWLDYSSVKVIHCTDGDLAP